MEKIRDLIAKYPATFFTLGKKEIQLVDKAEEMLEVKLPESFRNFLLEWGKMGFKGLEYYGISSLDNLNKGLPDLVYFNLDLRSEIDFPKHLVAFHDSDGVEFMCLDTSNYFSENECSIVLWDNIERCVADRYDVSFLEFLLGEIEQAFDLE